MTLYGGLFEIKKDDCNKLDRYEDYPCSYNRKKVIANLHYNLYISYIK